RPPKPRSEPGSSIPKRASQPLTCWLNGGCAGKDCHKGLSERQGREGVREQLRYSELRRVGLVQESPSDSTRPPAEGRRLGGGAIASLSGVGLLLIFMIQNTERVRLDFIFWNFTWPLWLLTMVSALLGAL